MHKAAREEQGAAGPEVTTPLTPARDSARGGAGEVRGAERLAAAREGLPNPA